MHLMIRLVVDAKWDARDWMRLEAVKPDGWSNGKIGSEKLLRKLHWWEVGVNWTRGGPSSCANTWRKPPGLGKA